MNSLMNNQNYLEQIIKESTNIKGALTKMGMMDSGKNYKTIKKYIQKFNINISHFETRAETIKRIKCTNKKYELSDILVEDFQGSITGNTLKEYLYKAGLKERNCEKCKQGEIWLGDKISLILDHINGVHSDNRIGNLRILCPNCNAATDTFAGKNVNKKIRNQKELVKQKEKEIKLQKINESKETKSDLIIKSGINFSRTGWGIKLGKYLEVSPQYATKWVKENMVEFYQHNCFQHKNMDGVYAKQQKIKKENINKIKQDKINKLKSINIDFSKRGCWKQANDLINYSCVSEAKRFILNNCPEII